MIQMPPSYLPRFADQIVERMLGELPALSLVGPRAVGKTTMAARHARTVVRLDREAEAAAFRADPDVALAGLPEPVLLDEWPLVPSLLGAVKRAVDADPRPGRFLLSGSVRADLDAETWPGTGRIVRIAMHGLTERERLGHVTGPGLVERLAGDVALALPEGGAPDLRGYVERALVGGFPEPALRLSNWAGRRWYEGYAEALVTRDAGVLSERRDPARVRRYLEALALNTAGIVEHKTLYDGARIDRKTALAYDRLLENLLVVGALPAWSANRLKRLARAPKRYVHDSGLAAAVIGVDTAAVLRDGDILGRLLDTFVVAQLRAEVELLGGHPRLYHLRQEDGRHEVDVVVELSPRRVLGIEIKADAAPGAREARHLAWLRDELGKAFVAGVVLHTGPQIYELGDRIVAAPIAAMWGGAP